MMKTLKEGPVERIAARLITPAFDVPCLQFAEKTACFFNSRGFRYEQSAQAALKRSGGMGQAGADPRREQANARAVVHCADHVQIKEPAGVARRMSDWQAARSPGIRKSRRNPVELQLVAILLVR